LLLLLSVAGCLVGQAASLLCCWSPACGCCITFSSLNLQELSAGSLPAIKPKAKEDSRATELSMFPFKQTDIKPT
jgi:hypothetical protein